jgi:hypothetical protein
MARKTPRCTCPADGKLVFLGHLKTCPEVVDQYPGSLTFQQIIDRGLPIRVVAYWIDRYLHPIAIGGGTQRRWPQTELRVADMMRRLCDAGFTPAAAAVIARNHIDGNPLIRLAAGLTLAIDVDLPTERL